MRMKFIGLLAVLSLVAGTGCAAKQRHIATVTVVSAHGILSAIQDNEKAAVCGLATAPAAPACVTPEAHRKISAELVTAFDYDGAVAKLVRDWPVGVPQPANIVSLLAYITDAVNRIIAALPDGAVKAHILAQIGGK